MNQPLENTAHAGSCLDAASEILSSLRLSNAKFGCSSSGSSICVNDGACTLYMVLDGKLKISTQDGTVSHTLGDHQYAFVFGDQYAERVEAPSNPSKVVWCIFDLFMGEMLIGKSLLPSILFSNPDDLSVSHLVQVLTSELHKAEHHARPVLTSMVTTLLLSVFDDALRQGDRSAMLLKIASDEHLGPVVALMHRSPGDAWTLERLSNESGLSRSSFAQRFHDTFGSSAFAYLRDIRLSRAAKLLKTTSMTVNEIASEVGYSSESAFSSAFRESQGNAPGRFRDAYRVSDGSAIV